MIGKGQSDPVLVMTPFRFPDRDPCHPQYHSQQHSVPATIHTETHKETLTVKARNSVGINSPKHRQRDDDLEQSWELCVTYNHYQIPSACIVKEGPSAPTAPFPLCLNA